MLFHIFCCTLAGGKKSIAAVPSEENSESPTQLVVKDPDEKLILDSFDNGIKALFKIVSFSFSSYLYLILNFFLFKPIRFTFSTITCICYEETVLYAVFTPNFKLNFLEVYLPKHSFKETSCVNIFDVYLKFRFC